ncbi:hypothetical protein BSY17_3118 [Sphingobium sp. RAC03]|nr:hypothetical protein BSY17_3118 [Sphingobium sp. RAC03]
MHVTISDQPGEDCTAKQDVEVSGWIRRERPQPARHALDRTVIFCRCREIEDRAEILQRKTAKVARVVPNVEALDNESGRHAIRHRGQCNIRRGKADGAAQFQAKPFDDRQHFETCASGGLEDMGKRQIHGR